MVAQQRAQMLTAHRTPAANLILKDELPVVSERIVHAVTDKMEHVIVVLAQAPLQVEQRRLAQPLQQQTTIAGQIVK